MKSLKLIIAGIALIFSGIVQAQVSVTIGTPPPWGPAEASGVRFYYLPDIEMYFDVNTAEYVYFSGGTWIHTRELPPAYRGHDLYREYKVPLRDYHGDSPWERHEEHHKSYPKGYNHGHYQKTFGEHPGKGDHDDHDKH
jgi:hypothetical protein